jgi:DNA-binding response OmpR family regulator
MKILVVEDNEHIQRLLRDCLYEAGFEVVLTSNGDEALNLYRQNGPFDVVLTDRYHDGLDGLDLFLVIQKINSQQPVIMFTGRRLEEHERDEEISNVLSRHKKLFLLEKAWTTPSDLLRAVREAAEPSK